MSEKLFESYVTVVRAPLLLRDPEEKYRGPGGDSRTEESDPASFRPFQRTETAARRPLRVPGLPSSAPASPRPRLRDQLIEALRVRHYSPRTIEAYVYWNAQFVRFHANRPPAKLGKREIEQFLTHLAVERKVSASTQNQALAAILFLYKNVLGHELEWLDNVVRAKRPERLPGRSDASGGRGPAPCA